MCPLKSKGRKSSCEAISIDAIVDDKSCPVANVPPLGLHANHQACVRGLMVVGGYSCQLFYAKNSISNKTVKILMTPTEADHQPLLLICCFCFLFIFSPTMCQNFLGSGKCPNHSPNFCSNLNHLASAVCRPISAESYVHQGCITSGNQQCMLKVFNQGNKYNAV